MKKTFAVHVPVQRHTHSQPRTRLDIITALDGKKIAFRNEVDFLTYVAALRPGKPVQLQIRRAVKSLRTKLIPGELMPAQIEAWLALFRAAEENARRAVKP